MAWVYHARWIKYGRYTKPKVTINAKCAPGGYVKAEMSSSIVTRPAWNFFFLPPYTTYNTFAVHDPKDWLSLLVFLVVAVAMGMQTGRTPGR